MRLIPVFLCGVLSGCAGSKGSDDASDDGLIATPTAVSDGVGGATNGSGTSGPGPASPTNGTGDPVSMSSPNGTGNAPSGTSPGAGGASGGEAATGPAVNTPQGGGGRSAMGMPNGGAGQMDTPGGSSDGPSEPTPMGETPSTDGSPVSGDGCPIGVWPAVDPSLAGPFEVVTEENVGPEAGEPEDDGTVPQFTLFRPANMEQSGLCHPVITWGNGTGSTPNLYGGLLRHLTSHGFVVIGSNSKNVARGTPRPMNVGIDWVLEQNDDPSSALYRRIDTARIGATGHSQGAVATSQDSGDERIVTSLPIQGAGVQRNLNGPAMFFCGGQDDIVSCDGAVRALEAITTLPAMYANYLTADHGSWLSFRGTTRTDVEIAITAWMRVHLMADQALRPWFYGESCELCTNSAWEIDRKNMEE